MKPTKETILRTIVYAIALVNMTLTVFNKNPLPFSSEQAEAFFTVALDWLAGMVAWWKNNSFTTPAILSDTYMRSNKAIQKEIGASESADFATALELANGKENDYEQQ